MDLGGWDTACVIPSSIANQLWLQAAGSSKRTFSIETASGTVHGEFGPSEITSGGAGDRLMLHVPIRSGGASFSPDLKVELAGVVLRVCLRLGDLPPASTSAAIQSNVDAKEGPTPGLPVAACIALQPVPKGLTSVQRQTLLNGFTRWLSKNAFMFSNDLAAIGAKLPVPTPWMKPTASAFSYTQIWGEDEGCLAVLSVLTARDTASLPLHIDSQLLRHMDKGNVVIGVSRMSMMKNIVVTALPLMIKSMGVSADAITADETQHTFSLKKPQVFHSGIPGITMDIALNSLDISVHEDVLALTLVGGLNVGVHDLKCGPLGKLNLSFRETFGYNPTFTIRSRHAPQFAEDSITFQSDPAPIRMVTMTNEMLTEGIKVFAEKILDQAPRTERWLMKRAIGLMKLIWHTQFEPKIRLMVDMFVERFTTEVSNFDGASMKVQGIRLVGGTLARDMALSVLLPLPPSRFDVSWETDGVTTTAEGRFGVWRIDGPEHTCCMTVALGAVKVAAKSTRTGQRDAPVDLGALTATLTLDLNKLAAGADASAVRVDKLEPAPASRGDELRRAIQMTVIQGREGIINQVHGRAGGAFPATINCEDSSQVTISRPRGPTTSSHESDPPGISTPPGSEGIATGTYYFTEAQMSSWNIVSLLEGTRVIAPVTRAAIAITKQSGESAGTLQIDPFEARLFVHEDLAAAGKEHAVTVEAMTPAPPSSTELTATLETCGQRHLRQILDWIQHDRSKPAG